MQYSLGGANSVVKVAQVLDYWLCVFGQIMLSWSCWVLLHLTFVIQDAAVHKKVESCSKSKSGSMWI